jgi:hypothetical protein
LGNRYNDSVNVITVHLNTQKFKGGNILKETRVYRYVTIQ